MEQEQISEEELQEKIAEYQEFIRSLPIDELMDRLAISLQSTEIILEGYNLVNNIDVGQSVTLAAIIRLREAVGEAIDWLDYNTGEEEEENEDL